MTPNIAWLAGLSPWPTDGFGLDRMRRLLALLGEPQKRVPAIHVVGTNGKTTATRTIEAALVREGLLVGATVSPHVRAWSERITVGGTDVDLERALGRVREAAESASATQFETITAAALAEFAAVSVDVAVVEAGLGGRHDATNVLETRVVLLTNVSLEHTDVLGDTVGAIATEKLAVARPGALVVLPEQVFAQWLPVGAKWRLGGAQETVEAFLGRRVPPVGRAAVPGRLERRRDEVRDGAHTPDGVRWLAAQLGNEKFGSLCVAMVGGKDVGLMLDLLRGFADTIVATTSSSARAIPADELAAHARHRFAHVEAVPDPVAALARAHQLGEPVLVTGSLYHLADLAAAEADE